MRALLWKEMRENLKWALLAMAVLGIAEMCALHPAETSNRQDGVTLVETTFLMVTTFGSAAAGLLLGLLQILPELRRDQWAGLLHRPASRGAIYMGKVVAGLILYAVATLPPFLLSVWLVATPGHFSSPFVPGMVLPGLADICTGVVYYFAALVLALERGKWPGLRAFALLAAFHCSFFVDSMSDLFRAAVAAAMLMAVALCVAGWGAMLDPEKFSARPWAAKAALLAVVFYGACGFGDLGLSLLDVVGPEAHSHHVEYVISEKWVPLRVTYDDDVCVSVTDPDGKPVTDPDEQPSRVGSRRRYLNGFSSYIGDTHGWKEETYGEGYRDWRKYLTTLEAYTYPKYEQWYYLEQQRSLIGYLALPKKAVARFDRNGFEPAEAVPRPFQPEATWCEAEPGQIYFWDGSNLSAVLLPKRETTVLALPGKGPVFGIGIAWARENSGSSSVFGATLLDRLALYDQKGGLVAAIPYHRDVDRWGQLSVGANVALDRFYLWYRPSAWIDGKTRQGMPSYFDEVNKQGEVLRTWKLPPLPPRDWGADPGNLIAGYFRSPAFFFGGMAYQKIGALLGSERLAGALARSLGPDRKRTEEFGLTITLISAGLAAATLVWARRVHFSWSRAGMWAGFVLAFNVAGLIAFRLVADWPRMIPCPRCRRPRPLEEALCPHCSSGWPAPEPAGTEVFDNAAAAPAHA